VRTIPRQSHSVIRNDLSELAAGTEKRLRDHFIAYDRRLNVDRDRDLKIQTEILTDRPHTVTDLQDPVVQAADWATKQISGRDPVHGGVPGTTDGTFLRALKGIPIVTMGAGARHIPHQADEWVDLDQLTETAKIYALTGLYYLNPQ
jgi:succinyl-diaminopimelate desuccinylase